MAMIDAGKMNLERAAIAMELTERYGKILELILLGDQARVEEILGTATCWCTPAERDELKELSLAFERKSLLSPLSFRLQALINAGWEDRIRSMRTWP